MNKVFSFIDIENHATCFNILLADLKNLKPLKWIWVDFFCYPIFLFASQGHGVLPISPLKNEGIHVTRREKRKEKTVKMFTNRSIKNYAWHLTMKTFLSPNDNLRSKLVECNKKLNNMKETFPFVLSLSFILLWDHYLPIHGLFQILY